MTTTPNPTAGAAIALLAGRIHRLKAQLAESERARAKLRAAFRELIVECEVPGSTFALHLAKKALSDDALAADQTTARESAESTAEETMTNRCDTKQGPCACGAWHDAQTPEPVEPSGPVLALYAAWSHTAEAESADFVTTFRGGYRAGLAAEAAAHAETKADLTRRFGRAIAEQEVELGRVRAQLVTEVEKRHEDYAKHRDHNAELIAELERVRGELDEQRALAARFGREANEANRLRAQARARRVPSLAEFTTVLEDYCDSDNNRSDQRFYDAVLRLFAEAPPIGVSELAEVIANAMAIANGHVVAHVTSAHRHAARAVLRLLAPTQDSPGASSDPPVPLPEVLPVGTRSRHGSVSDTSVCLRTERGSHAYWGRWNLVIGKEQCVPAEDIDWSHYRAQQRAAEATPEAAWNYSAPPDSEIGKMHELLAHEGAEVVASVLTYSGRDREGFPLWGDKSGGGVYRIMGGSYSVRAWRPASAAPAKVEPCLGCDTPGERCRKVWPEQKKCCPDCSHGRESDSAWLKRTVEELTTARPVEVIEDELGHLQVSTTGDEEAQPVSFRAYVDERNVEGIRSILARERWPMRRNAKPAEPSPQPGGFLDALTRRVAELELQARVEKLALAEVVRLNPRNREVLEIRARIEREERERVSQETHSQPAKQ